VGGLTKPPFRGYYLIMENNKHKDRLINRIYKLLEDGRFEDAAALSRGLDAVEDDDILQTLSEYGYMVRIGMF
jgi:hypothetical protein